MIKKKIHKRKEILKYLLRYKAIDRQTAITHFQAFDLPHYIREIGKIERQALKGLKIERLEGSSPNTKYVLK